MSDKDKVQADWLDVFRVAAMVMVFVLHLSQRIISNGAIARFFNNMGFAGVSAFFVLSGYLIPASYERCGTKKCFYIKRIFRILPVYYVILMLNMIFRSMPQDITGLGWWRYILCINVVVPAWETVWNSFAGLWTISMFVFYYLMVPFLGCLGRDWKKSLVVALSINSVSIVILKCMKIIFAGEFGGNLDFIERSFLRMLPIFLLGTAALSAKREKKERELSFALALYVFLLHMFGIRNDYFFFGSLVTIAVANMETWKMRVAQWINKGIKILGGYSFLVYMVHLTVFDAVDHFGLKEKTNTVFYSFFLFFCVAVSVIIIHFTVERPILCLEKKLLKKLT